MPDRQCWNHLSDGKEELGQNFNNHCDHFNLLGYNIFFFEFKKLLKHDLLKVGARELFYMDKMKAIQHGINNNRTNK
jgi:hypothetical protein